MENFGFNSTDLSRDNFMDVVERIVENRGFKNGVNAISELPRKKLIRVFANESIRNRTEAILATGRLVAEASNEGYLENEASQRMRGIGLYPVEALDRKTIEQVMKDAEKDLMGSKDTLNPDFVGLVDASTKGKVSLSGVRLSENAITSVNLDLDRF